MESRRRRGRDVDIPWRRASLRRYGRIVDPGLRVNHSWEGALATLNVAHQWDTWTRRVTKHEGDAIEYPQDLPGLAGVDPTIYPAEASLWDGCEVQVAKCNQYWLSGKREALDAPREWFHDADAGALYVRRADILSMNRGGAAAGTWIFSGDKTPQVLLRAELRGAEQDRRGQGEKLRHLAG